MNHPADETVNTTGLHIEICGPHQRPVPCWVTLADGNGRAVNDTGGPYPGFPCSGTVDLELKPGSYQLIIRCGPLYRWHRREITLEHEDLAVSVQLAEHVDLRARGWFCFDMHNHLAAPATPETIAAYLDAHAIDGVGVCQPWTCDDRSYLANDGERLARYLASGSTDSAHLYFGAEFPKTRYGHAAWFRMPILDDPRGPYADYHDTTYFDNVKDLEEPTEHPSRILAFDREWNVNKILRWKKRGGVNAALHPTSWWTDRENQKVVTTNIAVDYIYGLFAGGLYDTLVVMGYDEEHVFYQNLWFQLLNRGYRIAAVAESDGALRGKHPLGKLRQYSCIGQDRFDRDLLCDALKAGHSFMTSGPLLFVTGEDGAMPGDVMPTRKPHELHVEAYADADPDEYLTWLVLYRNGEVAEIIDVEARKPRRLEHTFRLTADVERAWYVVKVYGSTRPARREFVDIMKYAALCEHEHHQEYKEDIRQVAFTNPIYVEPEGYEQPAEIRPHVRGVVSDSETGAGLFATIHVMVAGEQIERIETDGRGAYSLALPLTAELRVESSGHAARTVNPVVHYQPMADLLDEVLAGQWALNPKTCWVPGQMPFKAFQFDRLRQLLLDGLVWNIDLQPS